MASLTVGLERLDRLVAAQAAAASKSGSRPAPTDESGSTDETTRTDATGAAAARMADETPAADDTLGLGTGRLDGDAVTALRARLTGQLSRAERRIASTDAQELPPAGTPVPAAADIAIAAMRRSVIDAQREELLTWRDAGRLPDTSLRILQRELDHEEHALPGMNPM